MALTRLPEDGLDTVVATVGDTAIRFTIVYVEGDKVRVAVDAPQEFGKWRQKNIPWMSQSSAQEHMQVYKKFGSQTFGCRDLPGFATLELLARDTTPEGTVERVLEGPEGWTVKEQINFNNLQHVNPVQDLEQL